MSFQARALSENKLSLLWVSLVVSLMSPFGAGGQVINDPKLQVRNVASVNDTTTTMAFIGVNDILVLQKNDGRVRRVINGVVQPGEVLDVNVDSFNGRGLLGITLHPNFATNGFVYLYYTKSTTAGDVFNAPLDNRVERYTWNGTALVNPTLIISLPVDTQALHVGGIITFGPDGKLYIVIGYEDRNGKLQNNSAGAEPDDTGVVLRLNDDGTIPADNPFFSQGGNLRKYFAYGIRNSFGMAFDPLSGKLWMTDNGDEVYDEINLVLPGLNSGWAQIMGPLSRNSQGVGDLFVVPGSQYADPKFSWLTPVAPTAIVIFNSLQLGAQYQNDVFVSDYNNTRIYHFKFNAARDGFVFDDPGLTDLVADDEAEQSDLIFGSALGLIIDLKIGPDGKLYLLNLDGTIKVIERRLQVICPGDSLQAVIDDALPGDLIQVSGICHENLLVRNEKQRVVLDGGATATISGVDATQPALNIRGKGITVQGFTISGGVLVNRGSNAVINNNDIHNTGGNGVSVDELAFSILTNNTIHNNPGAGILVNEKSTARIGFNNDTDTVASANTIQNNGLGIIVSNSSSARIIGNDISSNSGDGIDILRDSEADIASNTINGNGGDGIEASENSFVQLGEDTGSSIYQMPNTTTVTNTGFGIKCTTGGVADGRQGTLTGAGGARTFDSSCVNDLLP